MFEDYLEDARYFIDVAGSSPGDSEKRRGYRAAVFAGVAAIEAFVNYVGETLGQGGHFPPHEIAFLTDKAFGPEKGQFKMLDRRDFHSLEDKVRFLIHKFSPEFEFSSNPLWPQFVQFKQFRDSITHPHQADDPNFPDDYRDKAGRGLSTVVQLIALLCRAVFDRPLRPQLMDLGR